MTALGVCFLFYFFTFFSRSAFMSLIDFLCFAGGPSWMGDGMGRRFVQLTIGEFVVGRFSSTSGAEILMSYNGK
jgi:hypothetical protein